MRHRWDFKDETQKAGKCNRCKLKFATRKFPDGRRGREKIKCEKIVYFVNGEWCLDKPVCVGPA